MATIKKGKSNKKINFEDIDLDDSLQPTNFEQLVSEGSERISDNIAKEKAISQEEEKTIVPEDGGEEIVPGTKEEVKKVEVAKKEVEPREDNVETKKDFVTEPKAKTNRKGKHKSEVSNPILAALQEGSVAMRSIRIKADHHERIMNLKKQYGGNNITLQKIINAIMEDVLTSAESIISKNKK